MIRWNKVFEMPHREKAFGEGVGSAHEIDLLGCDGKTNLPESTFDFPWRRTSLRGISTAC